MNKNKFRWKRRKLRFPATKRRIVQAANAARSGYKSAKIEKP